jgi:hypothetical protein
MRISALHDAGDGGKEVNMFQHAVEATTSTTTASSSGWPIWAYLAAAALGVWCVCTALMCMVAHTTGSLTASVAALLMIGVCSSGFFAIHSWSTVREIRQTSPPTIVITVSDG